MRAVKTLPEGCKEIYSIDLQKDKKISLVINLITIIISVLLIVPMHFCVPISSLFDMKGGLEKYSKR